MEELSLIYQKLMEKYKETVIFGSAQAVVHWDMETMMPPKAIELRSQQLALMSGILHKMTTNPEVGKLLDKIERHTDYNSMDEIQKRNVYLIRKNYDEQTKLPEELVKEMSKQQAIAVDVWKKAKAAKNFAIFEPELEKNIELAKKAADILMKVKNSETSYDALVDIFEPTMTSHEITRIFDKLKNGLVAILEKCRNSSKQPDVNILNRNVPVEMQRRLAITLTEFVQYDVTSKTAGGRIDETEHPFTTGYYDDVRITTHYFENMFASSIFSVLHEAGHAMYEQDLKPEWKYQPVGSSCSSGLHESQSRTIENIIGRSREFWTHFLPKLKKLTGRTFEDIDLDRFVHAINQVKPSKIRVEADEVTYCLHITIRFNIERDLFADKITVKDLPEIWNQSYKEYLGMKIEHDSEGVMQDTHWASGFYGYFPSYALGNIYSGQLLAKMEKDIPDWNTKLSKGDFKSIKQWLVKNVHSLGNLYDPPTLLKKATGRELAVEPYLTYLNDKFSKRYAF